MKRIVTGGRAKKFTLKDQHGEPVNLSALKGKRVLLSFHPLAWTLVCAKQMKALEKNYRKFEKLNTIPLGLSVDTVPSKNAWAKALGIKKIKLLADFWPHGKVAKLYGIFRDKNGFSERANIIIDEKQRVLFVKVYPIAQLPNLNEIIRVLTKRR
jgi:peroxiredoxin